jgi:hypothetical protein
LDARHGEKWQAAARVILKNVEDLDGSGYITGQTLNVNDGWWMS